MEELKKKVDDSLSNAMANEKVKQVVADEKEKRQKKHDAIAVKAADEAVDAGGKVDDMSPETAAEALTKQLKADRAMLASKIAAREAKEAAANVSKAAVEVRKDVQLKRLIECNLASEETTKLKKEVTEYEVAIQQAKDLSNQTKTPIGNLTAAVLAKKREVQKSEEKEASLQKALAEAKVQTKGAKEQDAKARKEAKKAQKEEEDAKQALAETAMPPGSDEVSAQSTVSDEASVPDGSSAPDDSTVADQGKKEAQKDSMGCRWVAASECVPEFKYGSKTITGCTDADRPFSWCSHDAEYIGTYSKCEYVCDDSRRSDDSNFPAEQETAEEKSAESADDVTAAGSKSDTIIKPGSHEKLVNWGHGVSSVDPQGEIETAEQSSAQSDTTCDWQLASGCVKEFKYDSAVHKGCTKEGLDDDEEDTPWCSMDKVYVGRWKVCAYECAQVKETNEAPASEDIEAQMAQNDTTEEDTSNMTASVQTPHEPLSIP
jgi:hypothetical protein